MKSTTIQAGFSAVELLITLFIAALFIMMGYQLYGVSISTGGEVRSKAAASNEAYTYLHYYSELSSQYTCAAINSGSKPSGIPANITLTLTCPNPTELPDLRMTKVTATKGNPSQEVSHAIYTSK